jgi:hypothetical protein
MFVAAMALVMPCSICVFSTGRRASAKLLAQIKTLMLSSTEHDAQSRIIKSNQEDLDVKVPGRIGKNISQVRSYPAGTSTLRGSGGDLLVLEEAGFMNEELFLGKFIFFFKTCVFS